MMPIVQSSNLEISRHAEWVLTDRQRTYGRQTWKHKPLAAYCWRWRLKIYDINWSKQETHKEMR